MKNEDKEYNMNVSCTFTEIKTIWKYRSNRLILDFAKERLCKTKESIKVSIVSTSFDSDS